MSTQSKLMTPELDKLQEVREISQKIGEFIEWLQSTKHYVIAEWNEVDSLQPVSSGSYGTIESLLAEYFTIDLAKVESEKQAILTHVRSLKSEMTQALMEAIERTKPK